ncbi:MAG: hypothetical protein OXF25_10405 [Cyanobacteria bacterium MAG CAR3_bin_5]|nr:hypothetical protein [Cyanobacteria bacterium MAG CAR3_bin_5]MCY4332741.1 hypothetical protein [Cyanobacteria bacterium MAG CAR1_bin_15]
MAKTNQPQSFPNSAFASSSIDQAEVGAVDFLSGPVNTIKPPGSPPWKGEIYLSEDFDAPLTLDELSD